MLVAPVLLSVWIVLIVLALQGKNWARILLAIGIASSALSAVITLRYLSYSGVHYGTFAVSWIFCLLRIGAGYLLFTPASNAWFQQRSTNSSAPR
jgi:predicted RND superfamily exporter protein